MKLINIAIRKILIVSLLIAILSEHGQTQNIKKIYKSLSNNEVEEAIIEYDKFPNEKTYKDLEYELFRLADCLIVSNKIAKDSDPYKAFNLYKSKAFKSISEIDEFLGKYGMNLNGILDTIFYRILEKSKIENTESSYTKALNVCDHCFYKEEVIKLQHLSAYNETKKTASLPVYKEFISKYPNSDHVDEINNLMESLAFSIAKSNNNVVALKSYIQEYSKRSNKYLPLAINLRDSLAFVRAKLINTVDEYDRYISEYSNQRNVNLAVAVNIRDSIAYYSLKRNYKDYKKFVTFYPKTKFTKNIQGELANLLLEEANEQKNITLYEKYLTEFPLDIRKDSVNLVLENLYYNNLKNRPSVNEVELFKVKFPNSKYILPLEELISKQFENSDMRKQGLKGAVKSIIIVRYQNKGRDDAVKLVEDNESSFQRDYNELGNLVSESGSYDSRYDDIVYPSKDSRLIEIAFVDELEHSKKIIYAGRAGSAVGEIVFNTIIPIKHEYNENGRISVITGEYNEKNQKIEYQYDPDGKLLSIDKYQSVYDFRINNPAIKLRAKTKYVYDKEGRLIEENRYNEEGDCVLKNRIKYFGNNQVIEQSTIEKREQRITLSYTNDKLLTKKIIESPFTEVRSSNGAVEKFPTHFEEYNYLYSNRNLSQIYYFQKNNIYNSQFNCYNWDAGENISIKINRDLNGEISSYVPMLNDNHQKKTVVERESENMQKKSSEWQYKYDLFGNWVEREEYVVFRNDIVVKKIVGKTKRIINYY